MTRTVLYLGGAAALAAVALALGLPRVLPPAPPPNPVASSQLSLGSLTFLARLSHPLLAPGSEEEFATLEVRAGPGAGGARGPVNLALALDRSGSMAGAKLAAAKRAALELVSQLGPQDCLTVVHFGSDAVALPGLRATPENLPVLRKQLEAIWDDGGTNLGEALAAAGKALKACPAEPGAVARVLLVTDGQPTEGLTAPEALLAQVQALRAEGPAVSALGVGEDYDEALLQALAEAGAGAYGYLEDAGRLAEVLRRDLDAARSQVAREVAVRLTVPPGVRLVRVLGHASLAREPLPEGGERVTVPLPDLASGQVERLVAELAVEGGARGAQVALVTASLSYLDVGAGGLSRSGSLRLRAVVSADPAQVSAQRDPEAVLVVARAQAAANAEAAARQAAAGDLEGVRRLVEANHVLFQLASGVVGHHALSEDEAANARLLQQAKQARTDEERSRLKKAVNQKARQDYGLVGSTY